MGRIVETLWDCPYCSTKGIRGRLQTCPNCGRTRSKDTKFYLPEQITYVDHQIEKGPDWFCPFCDSYNPHGADKCKRCGAPRDRAETYFDILRKKGQTPDLKNRSDTPPETERYDDSASSDNIYRDETVDEELEIPRRTPVSPPYDRHVTRLFDEKPLTPVYKPLKSRHKPKLTVGRWLIIGILLLIVILTAIFIPRNRTITVDSMGWTREITVEENRLIEEDDWSIPNDAVEILSQRQEIHHYDKVLDHYETVTEQKSRRVQDGYDVTYTYRDLGNGYAEQVEHRTPRYRTEYYTETHQEPVYRNEPVYRTKYYYTVWRYVYDHTETASGIIDNVTRSEPAWPVLRLAEMQREGRRSEKYTVKCLDKKNKTAEYKAEYEIWSQLTPGNTYNVKTSGSKITEIVS